MGKEQSVLALNLLTHDWSSLSLSVCVYDACMGLSSRAGDGEVLQHKPPSESLEF